MNVKQVQADAVTFMCLSIQSSLDDECLLWRMILLTMGRNDGLAIPAAELLDPIHLLNTAEMMATVVRMPNVT